MNRSYDVPEGSRIGPVAIPPGSYTAGEIAQLFNASGKVRAEVVPGGVLIEEPFTGGTCSAVGLSGGTARHPRRFILGRVRLYRDRNDKLADNPCARRHHAPGCRWHTGKGSSARGWWCVGACPVPALLDAKAARDEAEANEDD